MLRATKNWELSQALATYAEVEASIARSMTLRCCQEGNKADLQSRALVDRFWGPEAIRRLRTHQHQHMADWLLTWPNSTILKTIAWPLARVLLWTLVVILLNRTLKDFAGTVGRPIRMPQTPLSLQNATIGLILVFRTNQTNDRLREALREVARLATVNQEIIQMLVVHVASAKAAAVALVARWLALFGWALKAELQGECLMAGEDNMSLVRMLLPDDEVEWLSQQKSVTAAVLFRVRAAIGGLYENGHLDKESFKFIEDDLSKLADVRVSANRLVHYPTPGSYRRHSSRAISLWMGALPLALEGKEKNWWEVVLTVIVTGFLIFGLDAIAAQYEQPFEAVPLRRLAKEMSEEVAGVLYGWRMMPKNYGLGSIGGPEKRRRSWF